MGSRRVGSLSILAVLLLGASASGDEVPRPKPKDILTTEKALYSRHNVELIVRDFFGDRRGGTFLDVGCWHPIDASNTYYLEHHLDWSGIGVDALPEMEPKWKRHRPASKFLNYIVTDHAGTTEPFYRVKLTDVSQVGKPKTGPGGKPIDSEEIMVPTITLTKLLEQNGVSKLDFFSIDIEGHEPAALAGFDIERFAPALVCIEAKPKNREFIDKYFAEHGYERIERYKKYDEVNYYFTPKQRP